MSKFVVITTINSPTEAVIKHVKDLNSTLIIVADRKTPKILLEGKNLTVLDMEWQKRTEFSFAKMCPLNHYSRKNIGYLYAAQNGASAILDTDDDNIPYDGMMAQFEVEGKECDIVSAPKFANIYRMFTEEFIWPRGFPLSMIKDSPPIETRAGLARNISLVQGLADGDTDVDAIYRLTMGGSVKFRNRKPVVLASGIYSSVNSQSTMWYGEAFPYLYLPVTVSFRVTDILRGYIAQRGLAAMGKSVGFTGSVVFQKRNPHNLMKDFADEIELYLHTERLISILDNSTLSGNAASDIRILYESLAENNLVKKEELGVLDAWLSDLEAHRK